MTFIALIAAIVISLARLGYRVWLAWSIPEQQVQERYKILIDKERCDEIESLMKYRHLRVRLPVATFSEIIISWSKKAYESGGRGWYEKKLRCLRKVADRKVFDQALHAAQDHLFNNFSSSADVHALIFLSQLFGAPSFDIHKIKKAASTMVANRWFKAIPDFFALWRQEEISEDLQYLQGIFRDLIGGVFSEGHNHGIFYECDWPVIEKLQKVVGYGPDKDTVHTCYDALAKLNNFTALAILHRRTGVPWDITRIQKIFQGLITDEYLESGRHNYFDWSKVEKMKEIVGFGPDAVTIQACYDVLASRKNFNALFDFYNKTGQKWEDPLNKAQQLFRQLFSSADWAGAEELRELVGFGPDASTTQDCYDSLIANRNISGFHEFISRFGPPIDLRSNSIQEWFAELILDGKWSIVDHIRKLVGFGPDGMVTQACYGALAKVSKFSEMAILNRHTGRKWDVPAESVQNLHRNLVATKNWSAIENLHESAGLGPDDDAIQYGYSELLKRGLLLDSRKPESLGALINNAEAKEERIRQLRQDRTSKMVAMTDLVAANKNLRAHFNMKPDDESLPAIIADNDHRIAQLEWEISILNMEIDAFDRSAKRSLI